MAEDLSEDIKELVVARLNSWPAEREISIGSDGSFKKDDLIKHIKQGDDIGKKIVEVEMSFLRALKEGVLYDE